MSKRRPTPVIACSQRWRLLRQNRGRDDFSSVRSFPVLPRNDSLRGTSMDIHIPQHQSLRASAGKTHCYQEYHTAPARPKQSPTLRARFAGDCFVRTGAMTLCFGQTVFRFFLAMTGWFAIEKYVLCHCERAPENCDGCRYTPLLRRERGNLSRCEQVTLANTLNHLTKISWNHFCSKGNNHETNPFAPPHRIGAAAGGL